MAISWDDLTGTHVPEPSRTEDALAELERLLDWLDSQIMTEDKIIARIAQFNRYGDGDDDTLAAKSRRFAWSASFEMVKKSRQLIESQGK